MAAVLTHEFSLKTEKRPTVTLSQVPLPATATVLASAAAGATGMFFAYPMEVWKNVVVTSPNGTSQWQMLQATAKRGFFRGVVTGVLKMGFYGAIRLGFYPATRDLVLSTNEKLGLKNDSNPANAKLVERCLAAAMAGCCGAFCMSPLDVCLVLQTTSKTKISFVGALRESINNSGIRGLWRGFSALGARAFIGGATIVGVQDHTVTMLRRYNQTLQRPYADNTVVNAASVFASLVYTIICWPLEKARVRMSDENRLPVSVPRRYTNVLQCVARMLRDEGVLKLYNAAPVFFIGAGINTVCTFLCLEILYREMKRRKADAEGLDLVLV